MYPVSIHYLPNEKEDRNLVDEKLFAERRKNGILHSIASKNGKINAGGYLAILQVKIGETQIYYPLTLFQINTIS